METVTQPETKQSTAIDMSTLTPGKLKELLAIAEQKEKEEAAAKRAEYENQKHNIVDNLISGAYVIHQELSAFKHDAFTILRGFYKTMKEYADLKDTNKGSFRIKNADGTKMVEFSRQVTSGFDERAVAAEEMLKDFLSDFVKKKDKAIYELVIGLLDRNRATGELDIKNINKLYRMEDKFDDQRWKKAIALFKESYQESSTSFYVRFYENDGTGKPQAIQLNFSAINVIDEVVPVTEEA